MQRLPFKPTSVIPAASSFLIIFSLHLRWPPHAVNGGSIALAQENLTEGRLCDMLLELFPTSAVTEIHILEC